MEEKQIKLLKIKCDQENYEKLTALNNSRLLNFIAKYVELCNPNTVFVRTDSPEDAQYIRKKAIENREEQELEIPGHTVHFDGYNDQARDKANTKYLLPPNVDLGPNINATDREEGLNEIQSSLKNIMQGKEMYVCFFCLGPTNSEFSIPAVQITDSSYVAHAEGILYRSGYEEFKKLRDSGKFFRYVHSAGVLENGVSKDVDKRRVYIDLEDKIVYSINTQYAGNTVGLKKLSLRLAILKASQEGWLAEHMFVMGVCGPSNRITYFTGAFPSACGKTSTSMLEGETIIGDDIAYLRNRDGKACAVNVECGIFGIIRDVNPKDDPIIWNALTVPGEVIFSNVLVTNDKVPYWLRDGRDIPEKGINYSGEWFQGKKDKKGTELTHSHKNARYTVSLYTLENYDSQLDNPDGVEAKGIIYGGRDSDTWVPVQQAFDWNHGVLTMGAALESETTAATLGEAGVRKFNLMSNLDFLSIPLSKYINNHLEFAKKLNKPPVIFAVNYFLRDKNGRYLNALNDKRVWVKWMELRIHGDVDAIKTPMGYIPKYEDIKNLFKDVLNKDYTEENYNEQFTLRIPENIAKIDRIIDIYKKVPDAPEILFKVLNEQKERLEITKTKQGHYEKTLYKSTT